MGEKSGRIHAASSSYSTLPHSEMKENGDVPWLIVVPPLHH